MAALKVIVSRLVFFILLVSAAMACNHACERVIAHGCSTLCSLVRSLGSNGTAPCRAQSLCSFLLRGPPCLVRIPPAAARQEMAIGHGFYGKLATPLEELDMRTDTLVKPISSKSFFNASCWTESD